MAGLIQNINLGLGLVSAAYIVIYLSFASPEHQEHKPNRTHSEHEWMKMRCK